MRRLEAYLVPHDFSEPAAVALRTAAQLAKQHGGKLTVLHVGTGRRPADRWCAGTRGAQGTADRSAASRRARPITRAELLTTGRGPRRARGQAPYRPDRPDHARIVERLAVLDTLPTRIRLRDGHLGHRDRAAAGAQRHEHTESPPCQAQHLVRPFLAPPAGAPGTSGARRPRRRGGRGARPLAASWPPSTFSVPRAATRTPVPAPSMCP